MRKELRRIVQAGCLIDPERPYTLEQITSDRENAFALWKLRFAVSAADEKLDACGIAVECYVHAKSNALRVFALAKRGEFCHETQILFRVCADDCDRRGLGTDHRSHADVGV